MTHPIPPLYDPPDPTCAWPTPPLLAPSHPTPAWSSPLQHDLPTPAWPTQPLCDLPHPCMTHPTSAWPTPPLCDTPHPCMTTSPLHDPPHLYWGAPFNRHAALWLFHLTKLQQNKDRHWVKVSAWILFTHFTDILPNHFPLGGWHILPPSAWPTRKYIPHKNFHHICCTVEVAIFI